MCSLFFPVIGKEKTSTDIAKEAEILYALKVVGSNYSFSSVEGCTDLFRRMFSDSNGSQEFTLGET